MKKALIIIGTLCIAILLFGCGNDNSSLQANTNTNIRTEEKDMIQDSQYELAGAVTNIYESSIEIAIENTDSASGTYIVNIYDSTEIFDKCGNLIDFNQIKQGNKVELSYNGQTTKSIPPQVNAIALQVK